MAVARSVVLYGAAAVLELCGAWLIWHGVQEHRGWAWIGAGVVALGVYGFVATLQPDAHVRRILAAYLGVFALGALAWALLPDGFVPGRWVVVVALACMVGAALVMYGPRQSGSRRASAGRRSRARPRR
ncbi:YnfA family protein [Cellulomonas sp. P5_C5]